MLSLPAQVTVVDVAARDGLQSFPRWVDTQTKIAMVDRISQAGFPVVEVTGFVHPRAVPHLRDAEEVLAGIQRRPGTIYRALVPNARGAERAVQAKAPPDEILGLIVASDTYLAKNQNMTMDQAVEQAIEAFRIAQQAGLSFVMAIAGAFWDMYEGPTPQPKVLGLCERFHAAGIRKLYLAGSLGMEDPLHVNLLFAEVKRRWPDMELGFHVHNMSGAATANIVAALDGGASFLEGSICGIGGGIALPGTVRSIGNLASEDIVYLLNEMGIATGMDTDEVVAAARDVAALLDVIPAGHIAHSGSRAELMAKGSDLKLVRN
jgi:hydroxymethylglutaryl-CoA lyase